MKIFIICLCALFLIALGCFIFVVCKIRSNVFSIRYDDKHTLKYFHAEDFPLLKATPIQFKSHQYLLKGYIYQKGNIDQYLGVIVFCHGLGPGHMQYTTEINYLCEHGYLVVGYDTRGCGESSGKKINGFTSALIDLDSCLSYVENDPFLKQYPLLVIGHSMGGYAVDNITLYPHQIKGIVSLASFNNPATCLYEELVHSTGSGNKLILFFFKMIDFFKFGKLGLVSSIDSFKKSDVEHLLIAGDLDITVDYQKNHCMFEKILKDNPHYHFVTASGRYHRPLMTLDGTKYEQETIVQYHHLQGEYKNGKVPEKENQLYYRSLDYDKLVEIDEAIASQIIDFFASCLEK
jgi:hypothetical protein